MEKTGEETSSTSPSKSSTLLNSKKKTQNITIHKKPGYTKHLGDLVLLSYKHQNRTRKETRTPAPFFKPPPSLQVPLKDTLIIRAPLFFLWEGKKRKKRKGEAVKTSEAVFSAAERRKKSLYGPRLFLFILLAPPKGKGVMGMPHLLHCPTCHPKRNQKREHKTRIRKKRTKPPLKSI
ncbi:MAG: hypothetical protein WCJ84_02455 [Candidatus Peregrinibacteria bacterium]